MPELWGDQVIDPLEVPKAQVDTIRNSIDEEAMNNLCVCLALACNLLPFIGEGIKTSTLNASDGSAGTALAVVMNEKTWERLKQLLQEHGGGFAEFKL